MAKFRMSGGLDDFLRARGITHPMVVPVLRNQILILLVGLFVATSIVPETMLGIWGCAGFALSTYILYSWARFFSGSPLGAYSMALLRAVFLRFLPRLCVLAAALYVLLVPAKANPMALVAGVAVGTLAPVLTLAFERGTK